MNPQVPLVAAVAGAVALLVAQERAGRRVGAAAAKAAASGGFVLLAAMRADLSRGYDRWVLLALVACLVGDLLLAAPRGLAAGLAAFALGHLGFTVAFATVLAPFEWSPAAGAALALASGGAAAWLWPHLGRLRAPVLAYTVLITAMAWGAISLGARAGWMPPTAGVLFYLSDLAVARDRFVVGQFSSRVWGLPLYYAGQVLFALTLGG